ncbi:MAG: tRNA (adenosine(37)-N6)-threonylcarbamoyltransferase complex dimerization subunit type 1 TsaB [Gammaproteobacteria bacterium]|jgi:tRNA threonylcarbamoyladenosine biosynthesis protein TsaB
MKLLAIDTVTEACSVALWLDGEISVREEVVFQSHTEKVLPMVHALLAETGSTLSQVDAIVFDRGPGSFTGLRIGAGVTQGLALGLDRPVIPVSSLATLAQGAWRMDRQTPVLACIDARQAEVYWAGFQLEHETVVNVTGEHIGPADTISLTMAAEWYGVGTGFGRYASELAGLTGLTWLGTQSQRYPLAQDMFPLALAAWQREEWIAATDAIPVYLRDNVASPPAK